MRATATPKTRRLRIINTYRNATRSSLPASMLKTAAKLVNQPALVQKNEAPLRRLEKQNRKLNRGLFNNVRQMYLKVVQIFLENLLAF